MHTFTRCLARAALLVVSAISFAHADPTTVCTITVNSPDEKEAFRRNLPSDRFQLVELVERGRPDWLASACRKGVRCDVLVISGHFDGGDQFYSDRVDARESLPTDEMERVACSDSCPGLFSQLKEVYLFGCNTLNPEALNTASAEIARSLVRAGHAPADADRLSRILNERHADSNRDRMRQIFKDVPVIYGFSSKAPLGATAGPLLERYFQATSSIEIGSGRASPRLHGLFAPSSMTVAAGITDADPGASHRSDVCSFFDDRSSAAQKVAFIHRVLAREMAEVRMLLDPIERYAFSLTEAERRLPSVSEALDAIARDRAARGRYLEFARDADRPATRARMIALAHRLGWLSDDEKRAELIRMFGDRIAQNTVSATEVDLACTLNADRELDVARFPSLRLEARGGGASHAALLACLGSAQAHAQVVRALASPREDDVQIAQVYLRHRSIADAGELRSLAAEVARMKNTGAQVLALDTLARLRLTDPAILESLAGLFPRATTLGVQRAIAGVLIRADYPAPARPDLVRALRQHRLKSPDGEDLIDVLIRRLQLSPAGS